MLHSHQFCSLEPGLGVVFSMRNLLQYNPNGSRGDNPMERKRRFDSGATSKLQESARRPLSTFQRYFYGGEEVETVLGCPDKHTLDDQRDLVACASLENDRLNDFLRNDFGWCFKVSCSLAFLSLSGPNTVWVLIQQVIVM